MVVYTALLGCCVSYSAFFDDTFSRPPPLAGDVVASSVLFCSLTGGLPFLSRFDYYRGLVAPQYRGVYKLVLRGRIKSSSGWAINTVVLLHCPGRPVKVRNGKTGSYGIPGTFFGPPILIGSRGSGRGTAEAPCSDNA